MSSRVFRARTVYIVAGVWVLFLAAGGGRLIPSGSDAQNAFLTIAVVIEGLVIAFAIWQAVHWALTRPETSRSRKVRWILGVSVFAAFLVGEFFVYHDDGTETQSTSDSRPPVPTADRLDMSLEKNSTELLRDGNVAWVEWLTRSEHDGSYLRAFGRQTIAADKSSYRVEAGTKFVFKAPDQPARVFMADQAFPIPKSRDELRAIAQAVAQRARPSSEPVVPWSGDVYLYFTTYTEIKKDWTDGEFVEVDWASGGYTGDVGRAYIRIVKGRMISARDGFLGMGSRYKIMSGTVFDIKVPDLAVERHTASQNIYIAKSGWPPIGDLQPFFVK